MLAPLALVACGEPETRGSAVGTKSDGLSAGVDFEAKLIAADGRASSLLGENAAALNGEYAVVGAESHFESPSSSGAAYVFARVGTGWVELTKLERHDPERDQQFGNCVSAMADTIAVGAPDDSTIAGSSGAAYVFRQAGTSAWVQEQKLLGSGISLVSRFGGAVALHGTTLFVGAYEPILGTGSVYVFTRSGSTWSELARLTASDAAIDDYFGRAVATDGTTLLVGAPLSDDAGEASGSAYAFTLVNGVWTEQDKLTAPSAMAGELFGISVAVDGNTAVVGAQQRKRGTTPYGSVFVFERVGDDWQYQSELSPSSLPVDGRFGRHVALRGDTIAVGAPWAAREPNMEFAGEVYLFRRQGSTWGEPLRLVAPGGPYDSQTFGSAVALDEARLLVGAGQDNEVALSAGAAYVFSLAQDGHAGQGGGTGAGGDSTGGVGGSGGTAGSSAGVGSDSGGAAGGESGGTAGTTGGRSGAGGSTGGAGAGGSAGSPDNEGGAAAGDSSGIDADSGGDSGCGCRIGGAHRGPAVAMLVLLGAASLAIRGLQRGRRRKRRYSGFAAS